MNSTTPNEDRRHQIKYFINKFEAIPERHWCVGNRDNGHGQHCALGHTDGTWGIGSPETSRLADLFPGLEHEVAEINNGDDCPTRSPRPNSGP